MEQAPLVVCVTCGKPIFFCKAVGRDFVGAKVKAEDFVPLHGYSQPKDGDDGLCPECGEPYAMSGPSGIVLKLEGGSWWPHPPF